MAESVRLVFYGEVIDGYAPHEVKRLLAQLFKLDEAGVARLFSGARVVVNEAVDVDMAAQHVTRFARLGARVRIEAPVSLPAALRAATRTEDEDEDEIVCPNCGQRQSKRLLCHACATNMPMGIAAKLEAEEEARAAALQARQAKRGSAAGTGRVGSGLWGLAFEGRVGRLAYAAAGASMLAIILGLLAMVLKQPNFVRLSTFALVVLAVLFVSVRLTVLRCHDCNRSGWWSLLVAVPYVGALVSLLLSLMPGTAQSNDYGEPPQQANWLLSVCALVLMVASVATAGPSVLAVVMLHGGAPQTAAARDDNDDATLALLPREALPAYRTEYVLAKSHKAFAVSAGGAWGWKAGEALVDDAVAAALAACSARRQPHTPECVPVHVDSEWLQSSP